MTAVSPSVATGELDGAKRVADHIGIAHEIVRTDELARPGYRANGPDRCYFCKSELYDVLAQLAKRPRLQRAAQRRQPGRPGRLAAGPEGRRRARRRAPAAGHDEGRGPATRPRAEPAQRREARLTVPGEPHPLRHRGRPGDAGAGSTRPSATSRPSASRCSGSATTGSWAASRWRRTTSNARSTTKRRSSAAIRPPATATPVIDTEPFRSGRLNAALVRPAASR